MMIVIYKFNDLVNKEIMVKGTYEYEVKDYVDEERYDSDETYRRSVYDKYYDIALSECALKFMCEYADSLCGSIS